ncbi:SGNH/GDSL hydrolase family protein [Glaesserella sp.]|uniref:SGNH/GDSL hydrolase family protein n=1 Tax=Glaesserella sp. TaxID=2094731 RepID=UPI0035A0F608
MNKRSIRLKEFIPNQTRFVYSDGYYDKCSNLERGISYYIESDKDGFIITGNYHLSDKKIILMGDSFIESNFISADKKTNYLLEKLFVESGLDIEVLNAGVSGSTLLNLLNTLINKVIHIKRSSENGKVVIILFVPSNDSNVLRLQESYWNSSQYYSNILPTSGKFHQHNQVKRNKNDFINILRIFSEVCKLYDIQLFVTDIMHRNDDLNYYTINSWIKNICDENHISYIDISKQISLHQDYFYDERHLLPKGASVLAQLLYDNLVGQLGYICSPYLSIKKYGICQNMDLTNNVNYSEEILVNEYSEVSLWLNLKVIKKESYNSMLYCIDYHQDIDPSLTNLIYSQFVGYFSYIGLQNEGYSSCQFIKINIPVGVKKIKIGICRWNRDASIYVYNAEVKCISKYLNA